MVSYGYDQIRLRVQNNRSNDQAADQIADACIKHHWIYLVVASTAGSADVPCLFDTDFDVDFAKRSAWSHFFFWKSARKVEDREIIWINTPTIVPCPMWRKSSASRAAAACAIFCWLFFVFEWLLLFLFV